MSARIFACAGGRAAILWKTPRLLKPRVFLDRATRRWCCADPLAFRLDRDRYLIHVQPDATLGWGATPREAVESFFGQWAGRFIRALQTS